jgi:hypothetical protein
VILIELSERRKMGIGQSAARTQAVQQDPAALWSHHQKIYQEFYDRIFVEASPALKERLLKLWPTVILWIDVHNSKTPVPEYAKSFLQEQLSKEFPDIKVGELGSYLFDFLLEYTQTDDHSLSAEEALPEKKFAQMSHLERCRLEPVASKLKTGEVLLETFTKMGGLFIDGEIFYSTKFFDDEVEIVREIETLTPEQQELWVGYLWGKGDYRPLIANSSSLKKFVTFAQIEELESELQAKFPEFIQEKTNRFEKDRQSLINDIESEVTRLNDLIEKARIATEQNELDEIEVLFEGEADEPPPQPNLRPFDISQMMRPNDLSSMQFPPPSE